VTGRGDERRKVNAESKAKTPGNGEFVRGLFALDHGYPEERLGRFYTGIPQPLYVDL